MVNVTGVVIAIVTLFAGQPGLTVTAGFIVATLNIVIDAIRKAAGDSGVAA